MSKVKTIAIPEDVCSLIQVLQYEVDARKELLSHMIGAGVDTTSEAFNAYNKNYEDSFKEYNKAKSDMQAKYIEPEITGKLLNWNLNFYTAEVTCEIE